MEPLEVMALLDLAVVLAAAVVVQEQGQALLGVIMEVELVAMVAMAVMARRVQHQGALQRVPAQAVEQEATVVMAQQQAQGALVRQVASLLRSLVVALFVPWYHSLLDNGPATTEPPTAWQPAMVVVVAVAEKVQVQVELAAVEEAVPADVVW